MSGESRVLRVFVSATAKDLAEYRDVTNKIVRRLEMMPIAMEDFSASANNAVQVCYDKVQSADLFIGIYARRYGYIPTLQQKYTGNPQPDGSISLTEMEYDWAIKKGLAPLCFVLDENTEDNWFDNFTDEGDKASRLSEFKQKLGEKHVYGKFKNMADLALQVSTALAVAKQNYSEELPYLKSLQNLVPEMPKETFEIYTRFWQLESWFKQIVYVELRSAYGNDWAKKVVTTQATSDQRNDFNRLYRSREPLNPISYMTFADLNATLLKEWRLFSPYMPPQHRWAVLAEDISGIRTELTSFRTANKQNLERLIQIFRDIDSSLWKFCTSYNDIYKLSPSDALYSFFKGVDYYPMSSDEIHWTRKNVTVKRGRIGVDVYFSKRQWQLEMPENKMGVSGFIYHVVYSAKSPLQFDAQSILDATHGINSLLLHMAFIDPYVKQIRITLSSSFGMEQIEDILLAYLEIFSDYLVPFKLDGNGNAYYEERLQVLGRNILPLSEQILGPNHPLTFLTRDIKGSLLL